MRVFVASDLHLHGNQPGGDQAVERMAHYICENGSSDDVLLLLGDYGNDLVAIRGCLGLFTKFAGKKLAVFGNHDLWEDSPNTVTRLNTLCEIATSLGFIPLDQKPKTVNGIAFAGSIGWYDYSLRDKDGISCRSYAEKIYPGESQPCWRDQTFVDWNQNDEEVVKNCLARLERDLEKLGHAETIIVGLHHIPTKKLLFHPRFLVPAKWRFMNAFLGSSKFASLFSRFQDQIAHVFCGHIHSHKEVTDSGVFFTSNGSTYQQKELIVYHPEDNTQDSVLF